MNSSQRRSRGPERGAALVEAVIAVPVFIVLLAGMIFLHQVASLQLQTMSTARNQAWSLAMDACGGSGGGPAELFLLTSEMIGAPGSDQSLINTAGGASGSSSAQAQVSYLGDTSGQGSGFAQAISSQTVVWCNDQVAPGSVPGVFQWFFEGE